jgi:hypothetical protein
MREKKWAGKKGKAAIEKYSLYDFYLKIFVRLLLM